MSRDLAINAWLDVIGEVTPPEKQKARSLLARVQGKERDPGMPEPALEPVLDAEGEQDVVDVAEEPPETTTEALPGDLHDLLSLFQ